MNRMENQAIVSSCKQKRSEEPNSSEFKEKPREQVREALLEVAATIGAWDDLAECIPSSECQNKAEVLRNNLVSWKESYPDHRLSDVVEFQINKLDQALVAEKTEENVDALAERFSESLRKNKESVSRAARRLLETVLLCSVMGAPVAHYAQVYNEANRNVLEDGAFSERNRAKQEMLEHGITAEQRSAYKKGISEFLERVIIPRGYYVTQIALSAPSLVVGAPTFYEESSPQRYDAWRLYIGLPQKYNTFGISDYEPQRSKEDKYYYKINAFAEELKEKLPGTIKKLRNKEGRKARAAYGEANSSELMNNFSISLGEDERGSYLAYYDDWDLDRVPTETSGRGFGRSFEIYDRIYYDPETLEIINPRVDGNSLAMAE